VVTTYLRIDIVDGVEGDLQEIRITKPLHEAVWSGVPYLSREAIDSILDAAVRIR
jgi:hypothetical protein